jgi:hypothetical protein
MSLPIRAIALAVLAMALFVSVGHSNEPTTERSEDLRSLVAPMPEIDDSGLLIDMVGFVGPRNDALTSRSDWEQWQREGQLESPAAAVIRAHADRIRPLQEGSMLPIAAPDTPTTGDRFEFREDHAAFRNVRANTAISDRFEFREDHTVFRNVQREPWFSEEDIQFYEESEILPGPVDSRWLLPNGDLVGEPY